MVSGWIMAYMVPKKGFDKYAVGCMVRDVEQSGYNRVIIKGDQENSISGPSERNTNAEVFSLASKMCVPAVQGSIVQK